MMCADSKNMVKQKPDYHKVCFAWHVTKTNFELRGPVPVTFEVLQSCEPRYQNNTFPLIQFLFNDRLHRQ